MTQKIVSRYLNIKLERRRNYISHLWRAVLIAVPRKRPFGCDSPYFSYSINLLTLDKSYLSVSGFDTIPHYTLECSLYKSIPITGIPYSYFFIYNCSIFLGLFITFITYWMWFITFFTPTHVLSLELFMALIALYHLGTSDTMLSHYRLCR